MDFHFYGIVFISKSNKEYLNYLNEILNNNEIGIKYKEQIDKQELEMSVDLRE